MSKRSPKHFFSKLASVSMPRSLFDMSNTDTVTIKADYLYPNYCQFVMPGDTWNLSYSNFMRMISPIDVPMMDNMYCDQHFWFVPFRLVWKNTKYWLGEKSRENEQVDYQIPQINFTSASLPQSGSIYDYFNIPIQGTDNILSGSFKISALPLRSYNLCYDEWYMDEQRCDYSYYNNGDTEDTPDKYILLKRGKRFDYMTSSLLEPQLGDPVLLPLGTSCSVVGNGMSLGLTNGANNYGLYTQSTGALGSNRGVFGQPIGTKTATGSGDMGNYNVGVTTDSTKSGLIADLSSATGSSIAQLRQMFQVQAYQEMRARNGQRMTEYLYGAYGVISPDARLQRPEFLGGTHQRLSVQPIVQTSSTNNTSPQGNLSAIVTSGHSSHVFTRSFTEPGYLISIINIYSDLTYYQGLDRHWSMKSPLDMPLPIFGNLSDEAIYKKELVLTGNPSSDDKVFGYGERYAWAKYSKNTLRGLVRPNAPQSIGFWSLAQQIPANVTNNDEFIESNTPVSRITSVTDMDSFIINQEFKVSVTRELPMYADPSRWMFRN